MVEIPKPTDPKYIIEGRPEEDPYDEASSHRTLAGDILDPQPLEKPLKKSKKRMEAQPTSCCFGLFGGGGGARRKSKSTKSKR